MNYFSFRPLLSIIFSAISAAFMSSCTHTLEQIKATNNNCFIYKDGDKTVAEGACMQRHQPQSTFKIAISLMGYDTGVLIDETHPMVPFVPGDADDIEVWKHPHNPALWLKNSCVWYSRFVTQKLGMEKFKKYVQEFQYGNEDVSGNRGENNGLINSWISSSLQISPLEQVQFLEKYLNAQLPVKESAGLFTHNILYLQDLPNGWKLYGKTGTGDLLNSDGSHDTAHERGWFIGWIEKGRQKIIFAQYIEVENIKKPGSFGYVASKQAKQLAIEKLSLIYNQ